MPGFDVVEEKPMEVIVGAEQPKGTAGTEGFVVTTSDAPVVPEVKDEKKAEKKDSDKGKSEDEDPAVDASEITRRQRKSEKTRKRISDLTQGRKVAQDETVELKNKLAKSEARVTRMLSGEAPNRDDYSSNQDFLKALDEGVTVKKVEPVSASDRDYEETQERVMAAFEDAEEKYDDFKDVVFNDSTAFSKMIIVALDETENPGEVAYYLAKNVDEIEKISKLKPAGVIRAIMKIEDQLVEDGKPPPKKQTEAPKPLENVLSGNRSTTPATELEDQSFNEFSKTRTAQKEARGKFW